ncbi:3-coathanger stack domain-containing protein [Emticicia sp. C21]|uniref:immunoglobulin domain-containing protein n=1 Tax=Emticicia sp. C21 TaxID=2302915 RepID=UPI000E343CEC|nr:3-coathanger stack domain-containing protein [Emticicia sp. C21]RFS13990.1 hypothetical protein D0T08_23690 [Emticicia sp. C21]
MKTTQVLFLSLFTFLFMAISFDGQSQTQTICGGSVPDGWVTISVNGTCGGTDISRTIEYLGSKSPGHQMGICGDPTPAGWVTISINGYCASEINGTKFVGRTIKKVEGLTTENDLTICGDPAAPEGWVTVGFNGNCYSLDGFNYESRNIKRVGGLSTGTELDICGDLPPAGWVTKSVSGYCGPSSNYISRRILKIEGMAAGTELDICDENAHPPAGWLTKSINGNCGFNSTYIARHIIKADGLPSDTELDICGDLPPAGWVTLTIGGNCGPNSAYIARHIKKVTCMPVNSIITICGDNSFPEGWVNVGQTGSICSSFGGNTFYANEIKKISGYPTLPAITISGPSNTTICSGQSVTLSASNCSWGTVKWSTGAQGASITVYPTTTTSYTATCSQGECSNTSNTIAITVTTVDVQVSPNASACAGKSVTLTASGCSLNYQWFTSNTSNTPIAYSSSYTTPALNSQTTYYVNCKNGNCESAKKSITVNIIAAPNQPNSTGQTICAGKTATLTATGCAGTYKWYSSNTSTTILASTASYTTPVLNSNTTYYVSCTVSCESSRKATTVTIGPSPTAPTASASGTAICNGQSVTLTATGCGGTVTWSNGLSGSSISVNTTGTYAAKCTVNGCISPNSNVLTITSGVSGAPENLTLSGTATAGVRTANKTITSTQVIPNGVNTTYNAGKNVVLNPPFNANTGSTFKIEIKGCG